LLLSPSTEIVVVVAVDLTFGRRLAAAAAATPDMKQQQQFHSLKPLPSFPPSFLPAVANILLAAYIVPIYAFVWCVSIVKDDDAPSGAPVD